MLRRVRTLYLCDPEKNTECRKTGCSTVDKYCEETFNIDFAKLNERGEPIVMGRFVDKEVVDEERST